MKVSLKRPIVKMDKKKKDKRPAITKKDVERFLWYCSDNDLLKVLLWAVGEVCVRFYKSKHSDSN